MVEVALVIMVARRSVVVAVAVVVAVILVTMVVARMVVARMVWPAWS